MLMQHGGALLYAFPGCILNKRWCGAAWRCAEGVAAVLRLKDGAMRGVKRGTAARWRWWRRAARGLHSTRVMRCNRIEAAGRPASGLRCTRKPLGPSGVMIYLMGRAAFGGLRPLRGGVVYGEQLLLEFLKMSTPYPFKFEKFTDCEHVCITGEQERFTVHIGPGVFLLSGFLRASDKYLKTKTAE